MSSGALQRMNVTDGRRMLSLVFDLKHLTARFLLGDIERAAFLSERKRVAMEIEKCSKGGGVA